MNIPLNFSSKKTDLKISKKSKMVLFSARE